MKFTRIRESSRVGGVLFGSDVTAVTLSSLIPHIQGDWGKNHLFSFSCAGTSSNLSLILYDIKY
jgi:hypothetical protein